MAQLTVEESFEITGRGTVVVFRGASLRTGAALRARVGGREIDAYVELILRRAPDPHERQGLLLAGVDKAEVPAGTIIELFDAESLSSRR